MHKILVAYISRTGMTEKMAGYIAEGIRMAGHEAELRKIGQIKNEKELEGYDGYIFGYLTNSLNFPELMKSFLATAR